ncbi:hypothetical protein [Shimia sp. Alg240-R146]|uniref:hypothetical protein n=1 Tax=Shimia sp. Alg240-R146 TaxID=2993449 RepID=UPI0022E84331|nr:hypothetical protein [Shimia sp. Alg240-R146]
MGALQILVLAFSAWGMSLQGVDLHRAAWELEIGVDIVSRAVEERLLHDVSDDENGPSSNCVSAKDFINASGEIQNWDSFVPCTDADDFFFYGIGRDLNLIVLHPGEVVVEDYFVIYKRYLSLKEEYNIGPMEAGDPGFLVLGLAAAASIDDAEKKNLYEAYSLHQLIVLHAQEIDQSWLRGETAANLFYGYFGDALSPSGIDTFGQLVCVVKYDVLGLSVSEIMASKAFTNCVNNL